MCLVDPNMLQSTTKEATKEAVQEALKPTVSDVLSDKIRGLDDEMNEILKEKYIPDYEKVKLYQTTLNKFLKRNRQYRQRRYFDDYDRDTVQDIVLSTTDARREYEDSEDKQEQIKSEDQNFSPMVKRNSNENKMFRMYENISKSRVPYASREIVSNLMQFLKETRGDFGIDRQGQMIIDGQEVPGSNVADLISDVTRKKSLKDVLRDGLKGQELFAKFLEQANVPKMLRPNTRYQDMVKKKLMSSRLDKSMEEEEGDDAVFGTPSTVIQTPKNLSRKLAKKQLFSMSKSTQSQKTQKDKKWDEWSKLNSSR